MDLTLPVGATIARTPHRGLHPRCLQRRHHLCYPTFYVCGRRAVACRPTPTSRERWLVASRRPPAAWRSRGQLTVRRHRPSLAQRWDGFQDGVVQYWCGGMVATGTRDRVKGRRRCWPSYPPRRPRCITPRAQKLQRRPPALGHGVCQNGPPPACSPPPGGRRCAECMEAGLLAPPPGFYGARLLSPFSAQRR